MKSSAVIQPAQRHQQVRAFASMAKASGVTDPEALHTLALACTPVPLLALSNHAIRGKKSLTRIQQLRKKQRFKVRKP